MKIFQTKNQQKNYSNQSLENKNVDNKKKDILSYFNSCK